MGLDDHLSMFFKLGKLKHLTNSGHTEIKERYSEKNLRLFYDPSQDRGDLTKQGYLKMPVYFLNTAPHSKY